MTLMVARKNMHKIVIDRIKKEEKRWQKKPKKKHNYYKIIEIAEHIILAWITLSPSNYSIKKKKFQTFFNALKILHWVLVNRWEVFSLTRFFTLKIIESLYPHSKIGEDFLLRILEQHLKILWSVKRRTKFNKL